MSNAGGLAGEVALVTGASRGIGRAIAIELGALGATVVGSATTEQGAAAIDGALAEHGLKGRGIVLDVADAASCESCLGDIESREGPVTILVNNAGITRDNLLLRMKQDDWDAVLNANLAGVFRLSKGVLRGMMKARKGRIINIASVVGLIGNPGQANYAAAKAGIIGFTRSLAREVASRGITANVVAPGFIETDMTSALPDAQRSALAGQIPLGRLGTPADVAAAVAFLASDKAAWITGETVNVNGGMHMP
jgi:3-oxoacyl-[acyl-carrier protein] reductase